MADELDVLWIGRPFPGCAAGESFEMETAIASLGSRERSPELIVVSQTRPGEVSQESIERLRRLAPLARIVGLLGSWCEGEARSGKPWPGVERVYWHQWPAWLKRELRRGSTLPPTATIEERLLAGIEPLSTERERSRGLVAICGESRELAQLWMDALRERGYAAVVLDGPPGQTLGVAAAIWSGDGCGNAELAGIRQLAMAVRPAPVIAVLGFPRSEDRQRAMAAGATAVLSKPLMLADLWASLPEAVSD